MIERMRWMTARRLASGFAGSVAIAMLALTAVWVAPASAMTAAAVTAMDEAQDISHAVCSTPPPGEARCMAMELVPRASAGAEPSVAENARKAAGGTSGAGPAARSPTAGELGLRPQDLHSAYLLPTSAPVSQAIALVDAYNDPTAEADLKVFSEEFGLPLCTAASGCFTQVNQSGSTSNLPFPKSTGELETALKGARQAEALEAIGWSVEISLDIETAHAICQNCHIMLVEAERPSFVDLYTAENSAARLGASEISNSWGGAECVTVGECENSSAFDHPGVVITAAAGDEGYLNWLEEPSPDFANYPASSPDVVAVGGTRLEVSASGEYAGESVWNDGGESTTGVKEGYGATGGGCSAAFTAPAWQQSLSNWSQVGCGDKRAASDVSADADPYTGIAVYDSLGECSIPGGKTARESDWCTIGGTSLASPLIAATFALAGGADGVEFPARTLYEREQHSPSLMHDVTDGSNGECLAPFHPLLGVSGCTTSEEGESCDATAICLAGDGYDGPTGVGTPDRIGAFETLAAGGRPAVVTDGASSITETTATVSASVNPEGAGAECSFEYGTTTAYGSSARCASPPGSGNVPVAVSADLPSLTASTVYHYRVTATNANGTREGKDATFTTRSPSPSSTQPPTTPAQQPQSQETSSSSSPSTTPGQGVAAAQVHKVAVPDVELVSRSLTANRAGVIAARVRCRSGGGVCAGTVTLRMPTAVVSNQRTKATTLTLNAGSFDVTEGRTVAVKLRLSSRARGLLARLHTLRAIAIVLARGPAGVTYTEQVQVTLHAAKTG